MIQVFKKHGVAPILEQFQGLCWKYFFYKVVNNMEEVVKFDLNNRNKYIIFFPTRVFKPNDLYQPTF